VFDACRYVFEDYETNRMIIDRCVHSISSMQLSRIVQAMNA
jgi:hypothetical protein